MTHSRLLARSLPAVALLIAVLTITGVESLADALSYDSYPVPSRIVPLFPTTTSISPPSRIVPGEVNPFTFTRPEGERFVGLFVPSTYNPNISHPLSFYLHGYGSNYFQALRLQIPEDAERAGYLLALPNGTPSSTGSLGWNGGVWSGAAQPAATAPVLLQSLLTVHCLAVCCAAAACSPTPARAT